MTSILLQAQAQGGGATTLIFMVGFFAIFYFFMIRPQMKRAKEQRKFQQAADVGDRVMTGGGIHGEIIEVDEKTVVIKLDQGRMRVEKSALSSNNVVTEVPEKK